VGERWERARRTIRGSVLPTPNEEAEPYERQLGYFGVDAVGTRALFNEVLAVLVAGWTHERLTFAGQHYRKAVRRNLAALRSRSASSRAQVRLRMAVSATLGT
jgi:hypothetical protein